MLAFRALFVFLVCSWSALVQAQTTPCLSAHEEAQRARRDGQFVEAHRLLLQCAQAECPRVVRNDCVTWADELTARTPSLVLAVKGGHGQDLAVVRVVANGVVIAEQLDGRAIDVDPGVYKLRFEAEGHSAREETISVREGEKMRRVSVQLDPVLAAVEPAPVPVVERKRVWSPLAISLGSVAVASGAAALGVGLWGKAEYNDLHANCGGVKQCSESDVQAGKRAYLAADVLAGVAAASAVAAVWVFVHDNRERSTALSAWPTRSGLALSLTSAF